MVSRQFLPRKIAPQDRVRVWDSWVRVTFSFRVGGAFPRGTIVLEPYQYGLLNYIFLFISKRFEATFFFS